MKFYQRESKKYGKKFSYIILLNLPYLTQKSHKILKHKTQIIIIYIKKIRSILILIYMYSLSLLCIARFLSLSSGPSTSRRRRHLRRRAVCEAANRVPTFAAEALQAVQRKVPLLRQLVHSCRKQHLPVIYIYTY